MYYLGDIPIRLNRSFKDAEGTQYPANWLSLATSEQIAAAGLVWVEPQQVEPYDERFYWGAGNPKALEDVNEVDENSEPILDADGNQIVTAVNNFIKRLPGVFMPCLPREVQIPRGQLTAVPNFSN